MRHLGHRSRPPGIETFMGHLRHPSADASKWGPNGDNGDIGETRLEADTQRKEMTHSRIDPRMTQMTQTVGHQRGTRGIQSPPRSGILIGQMGGHSPANLGMSRKRPKWLNRTAPQMRQGSVSVNHPIIVRFPARNHPMRRTSPTVGRRLESTDNRPILRPESSGNRQIRSPQSSDRTFGKTVGGHSCPRIKNTIAGWFRAQQLRGDIIQTRAPFRETDKALRQILKQLGV